MSKARAIMPIYSGAKRLLHMIQPKGTAEQAVRALNVTRGGFDTQNTLSTSWDEAYHSFPTLRELLRAGQNATPEQRNAPVTRDQLVSEFNANPLELEAQEFPQGFPDKTWMRQNEVDTRNIPPSTDIPDESSGFFRYGRVSIPFEDRRIHWSAGFDEDIKAPSGENKADASVISVFTKDLSKRSTRFEFNKDLARMTKHHGPERIARLYHIYKMTKAKRYKHVSGEWRPTNGFARDEWGDKISDPTLMKKMVSSWAASPAAAFKKYPRLGRLLESIEDNIFNSPGKSVHLEDATGQRIIQSSTDVVDSATKYLEEEMDRLSQERGHPFLFTDKQELIPVKFRERTQKGSGGEYQELTMANRTPWHTEPYYEDHSQGEWMVKGDQSKYDDGRLGPQKNFMWHIQQDNRIDYNTGGKSALLTTGQATWNSMIREKGGGRTMPDKWSGTGVPRLPQEFKPELMTTGNTVPDPDGQWYVSYTDPTNGRLYQDYFVGDTREEAFERAESTFRQEIAENFRLSLSGDLPPPGPYMKEGWERLMLMQALWKAVEDGAESFSIPYGKDVVDVTFGGEGNRNFYNKKIPAIMNKLLQPFGIKGKAGRLKTYGHTGTELDPLFPASRSGDDVQIEITPDGRYKVTLDGSPMLDPFTSLALAKKHQQKFRRSIAKTNLRETQRVRTWTFTPKMIEWIKKGVKLSAAPVAAGAAMSGEE